MKPLILISAFLFLLSCQSNTPDTNQQFKTIMLRTTGEAETIPDMANFSIDLSCVNKSIQVSKECLVDKSNEMNESLQSYGIAEKDIRITSVNLSKSYTWRNNSSVFEGYKSSTTMFVTVRDVEKLDDIYTELLTNRNLNLGGLQYSHSMTDNLENEAYIKALEKSEMLADKLLENLPENEKEILRIGNVELSSSMPGIKEEKYKIQTDLREGEMNQQRSIAVNKGTIKVTAILYVEYVIK